MIAQEFVEESVFDRRADAELYCGVELHHGGGEKVRGGMAEDIEGVRIFLGEDLEFNVLVDRAPKVEEEAAVFGRVDGIREDSGFFLDAVGVRGENFCDQRSVTEARGDRLGNVEWRGAFWHVFYAPIGECYVNLIHAMLS